MELQDQEIKKREIKPKSAVFGLLVLGFGVLLLLRNTGILNDSILHIVFSWQMLLIAIGLINIFDRNKPFGIVLIAIGSIFILPRIFDFPFDFHRVLWPVILIAVGLLIMFGRGRKYRSFKAAGFPTGDDYVDEVSIFSGVERNITSKTFKGGKVVTVFGGADLNFNQAELSPEINELEVICLFGGTKFIMPSDWNVRIEVLHIFGGFSDKRIQGNADPSKTIVIKGVTMFGGGEIKSF